MTVKLDVEKIADLLDFCSEAKSRNEMQEFCGISSRNYFSDNILNNNNKCDDLRLFNCLIFLIINISIDNNI